MASDNRVGRCSGVCVAVLVCVCVAVLVVCGVCVVCVCVCVCGVCGECGVCCVWSRFAGENPIRVGWRGLGFNKLLNLRAPSPLTFHKVKNNQWIT